MAQEMMDLEIKLKPFKTRGMLMEKEETAAVTADMLLSLQTTPSMAAPNSVSQLDEGYWLNQLRNLAVRHCLRA